MSKAHTISNLLLISAIIYFSIRCLYLSLPIYQINSVKIPKPINLENTISTMNVKPLAYYNPIIYRDFFKTKQSDGPPKPPIKGPGPNFKMKLLGTAVDGKGDKYAVIEDLKKREQNLYMVGDLLCTLMLKQILRYEVLLLDEGGELISLKAKDENRGRKQQRNRQSDTSIQKLILSRDQFDEAMDNIKTLMHQIKIQPYEADGHFGGLILSRIKPKSIFEKIGLQNRDIVTGINGKPIESVQEALQFYYDIQVLSSLSIDIKRRGKLKTLDLVFE